VSYLLLNLYGIGYRDVCHHLGDVTPLLRGQREEEEEGGEEEEGICQASRLDLPVPHLNLSIRALSNRVTTRNKPKVKVRPSSSRNPKGSYG